MSVSLLKTFADVQLALASAVSVGQTTATLSTSADEDGVALPSGKYGFTIDGDNSAKEYIVADLVGTALTGILHLSRQGASSSGFSTYHRVGATVTITDWAVFSRILNNLTAVTGFDAGNQLVYDAQPANSDPLAIPTVQYVLDTASGAPVAINALVIAGDAGENVASGEWVYYNTTDGEWYLTDADDTTKSLNVQIGKARGAGTNGNAISGGIFTAGLETVGTYVAGTTYYLGNTAGTLSTSAGTNSVVVGVGDANGDLILRKATPSQTDALAGNNGTPSSANTYITQTGAFIPGDGSDGDVALTSGTTTLTRDMQYNSLSVSGTAILETAGYRIFCKTTVSVDSSGGAVIRHNGNVGANAVARIAGVGGAAVAGITVPAGVVGASGNDGANGDAAGNNGATGTNKLLSIGVIGVVGGDGGAANIRAGGTGGTAGTLSSSVNKVQTPAMAAFLLDFQSGTVTACTGSSGSGGGGGGAANSGGQTGGGGGGAGASGGCVAIFANRFAFTGTNCIQARGGAGGNGGNGAGGSAAGGGGGGGGAGGQVILVGVTIPSTATTVSVSGGTGGTAGTGAIGTPTNGTTGITGKIYTVLA